MKGRTLLGLGVLALASLLAAGRGLSQDGDGAGGAGGAAGAGGPDDAAMQRWLDTMKHAPEHSRLDMFIGKWNTEMSMMGMPDKEKGTAEFTWLFPGGKWLQQRTTGSMMGMPMQGFGIHGYDNFKKKYVGCWMFDNGTNMLTFEGNYDRTGKVLMEFGHMDEPMTGEHDKMVQYVTREISNDEFIFELHDMPIGEPNTKVLEIRYTRVK
jgi:hypothetical protein